MEICVEGQASSWGFLRKVPLIKFFFLFFKTEI